MDRVESVRRAQEIRGAFARAADAGQLDDALRVDAHFEKRVNDAFGNRIVTTARAERGLAAFIDDGLEPDSIEFSGHRYSPPVMPLRPASTTRTSFFATSNPSCDRMS